MELFVPGEIVAYACDEPIVDLVKGQQGVVVFVYGEGPYAYEVNFLYKGSAHGNVWSPDELMKVNADERSPEAIAEPTEIIRWLAELDADTDK